MHQASDARYSSMPYHRCGKSGLLLPAVSLGFWHNFGDTGRYETMKQLCFTAFDHGITHFDLANNYGPEPGHDSALENLLSVGAIALIFIVRKYFFVPAFGAHLPDGHLAPDLSPAQSGIHWPHSEPETEPGEDDE